MSVVVGRWRQRLNDLIGEMLRDGKAAVQTRFGGGKESPPRLVVVFVGTPLQAQIVLGRLQYEGIPAMVQTESAGVVLGLIAGPLGEARILVPEAVAPQAQLLLEEEMPVEIPDEAGGEPAATDG